MIRAINPRAAARVPALRVAANAHAASLPAIVGRAWIAVPSVRAGSACSASLRCRHFASAPPPPPSSAPSSPVPAGVRGVIVPPSSFTPAPFVPDPFLAVPRAPKADRPKAQEESGSLTLFATMLLSMFVGSQIVHAILQPDVRIPDLGRKVIDETTGAVVIAPPTEPLQPLPTKRANPTRQRFVVGTQNAAGKDESAPAAAASSTTPQ